MVNPYAHPGSPNPSYNDLLSAALADAPEHEHAALRTRHSAVWRVLGVEPDDRHADVPGIRDMVLDLLVSDEPRFDVRVAEVRIRAARAGRAGGPTVGPDPYKGDRWSRYRTYNALRRTTIAHAVDYPLRGAPNIAVAASVRHLAVWRVLGVTGDDSPNGDPAVWDFVRTQTLLRDPAPEVRAAERAILIEVTADLKWKP